jgi:hypothetical protein
LVTKDITLRVDGAVLALVRRYAAEHNTTVTALFREYLTNLAQHEARARMKELSNHSKGCLGKKTWNREDLHGGQGRY